MGFDQGSQHLGVPVPGSLGGEAAQLLFTQGGKVAGTGEQTALKRLDDPAHDPLPLPFILSLRRVRRLEGSFARSLVDVQSQAHCLSPHLTWHFDLEVLEAPEVLPVEGVDLLEGLLDRGLAKTQETEGPPAFVR